MFLNTRRSQTQIANFLQTQMAEQNRQYIRTPTIRIVNVIEGDCCNAKRENINGI